MDYQKCARELIGYMIENEQLFKFCHGDVSEIAKGEGAVLLYLMDNDGVNASEISQRFDINTSRVAAVLNALSKKGFIERTVESYFQMLLEHLGEEDTKEYLRLSCKMNQLIKQFKSSI